MDTDYSAVPELNLLKAFQDRVGFGQYADGFGLTDYGDTSALAAAWSDDPEFLGRLVPFAQATDSGSGYALWRLDDRDDLATLPVVVFGDEGGQHVVTRNLRELLQLVGYDCEITVSLDDAYFYRGAHHRHQPSHPDYLGWLDEHFQLPPTIDPAGILAEARAEFGEHFARWTKDFLPG